MVMEADYRARGPHPTQQGPGMMPPMPQQQNWAPPYQQHVQQRQMPGLPPMVMQPGAPFHGPYPLAMQGMPFQGPVMYHVNGPAPAHLLAMHPVQHHPWAGQPYMQQPQHMQQAQMQAARRMRPPAPNQQPQQMRPPVQAGMVFRQPTAAQLQPGALGIQHMPAVVLAAAASGNPAISKSAARAVLVQPLAAGTARQAQAAAAGGVPLTKPALAAAAAAAKAMEAAQFLAGFGSDAESDYDDCAQSCESPHADANAGWAWLVDGVLQQVCLCCKALHVKFPAVLAACPASIVLGHIAQHMPL